MFGIKTFISGLVAILISPILLGIILVLALYSIIVYFIYEIGSVYLFLNGKSFTSDDPETVELKAILSSIEPGYYKSDQAIPQTIVKKPEVGERFDGGDGNA
jgi:hypothetical protein